MLEHVRSFQQDDADLGQLVTALRAEYVEADPHEARIRDEFEAKWSPMDGDNELRTETWAPPGAANDDHLQRILDEFSTWVQHVLDADSTTDHK
jgi:hypothetical protein